MTESTITFIGGGNMARALVSGLLANGYNAEKIWVSNPTLEKLHYFNKQFNVHTTQDNKEGAKYGDIIVFAVKPQHLQGVCTELKSIIVEKKPLLISIAAGVTTGLIQKWLCEPFSIVRAMPNIAASVNASATGIYANDQVSAQQKDIAESIFRAIGLACWLDSEDQLDVVVSASGSGPAYFFLIMEAIQEAVETMGLPSDIARLLVTQTALGASKMALESPQSLKRLREFVTSPKGTTEQAINVLEAGNIRELFRKALNAARQRSEEIAKMLDC